MHPSVLNFVRRHVADHGLAVAGQKVLEVGSYNVNGSVREVLEPLGPANYLGVDVTPGPGVDLVVAPEDELPGSDGRWDLVISTEMLEHAPDWRGALDKLKRAARPGGTLVLTTRSRGMPYHAFPIDCWRFSLENMLDAFADWHIESATADPDPRHPGVFLRARKPEVPAQPVDLSAIEAFPMADAPTGNR
jgi:SAM-dependent methyltransferase